jgi:hypothetical protein
MFVLCGLIISSTAAADQTCKQIAIEQRLAGAALLSFVKQCEVHAQMACAEAAHKMLAEPASESFIHTCLRKQSGRGLDGACQTIVATTPIARVALVVAFAGLASADNKVPLFRPALVVICRCLSSTGSLTRETLIPMGAWQAALAYVLFVASLAALIAKFGSMARSWS